ncbi:hypothetical protein A3K63_03810 [Candidatus Micrarchaeota archaeon RBG_16_49_10]|nr:MAG: hypothetical protein A3K63_03810 [Candidatus Micrarchaeota archaeon RBG_16_49_10]
MRKGINALEIIFSLFTLVIVTLVVIRMFAKNVNVDPVVTQMTEIQKQQDYEQAASRCSNLCSDYQLSDCDYSKAVQFCQYKVQVDLDENNKPGESSQKGQQHGAIVDAVPYCEDGFYCFHIKTNCNCGPLVLDADTCDSIMCEYLMSESRLTLDEAKSYTKNKINTGTCNISTKNFQRENLTFLDRDTMMGSGKNWFDIFGMGDCQRGVSGGGGATFTMTLNNCSIGIDSGGNANFDCNIVSSGSCRGDQTVAVLGSDDNTALAQTSLGYGSISVTATKLSGRAVLPPSSTPINPDSGCSMLTYLCDDPAVTRVTSGGTCTFYRI